MDEVLPPKTGMIGWFELFPLPQGDTAFRLVHVSNPKDFQVALYDYSPGATLDKLSDVTDECSNGAYMSE